MNLGTSSDFVVRQFDGDATVRWSCRKGEYVLWMGADTLLSSGDTSSWTIRDFWQVCDGDNLTITNRWADLPVWFEPHPLEVGDRAVSEMVKRLEAGYKPKEVMDGPNLWRAKTGDRLVWVSLADSAKPVTELLNLRSCALVLGENANTTSEGIAGFGAPEGNELPPAAAKAMRAGFDAAVALGVPRVFADEWRFGT
jgi:hypothetical protein